MKKLLLSAMLVASVYSVNAQISNDRGTFEKPKAGALAVEMLMSPNVAGGGTFNLNDPFLVNLSSGLNTAAIEGNTGSTQTIASLNPVSPMLKGRYFLSDNLALRVQVGILTASKVTKNEVAGVSVSDRVAKNGFALVLGVEKHFSGAERLSTYAGADLLIGSASAGSKVNDGTNDLTSKQSAFGFGLRGVTGFDYYFIPKVYLGAELGLGLSYNGYGVVKASGGTLTDSKEKSSSFTVTPFIIPAFRLGYRF
jgi:hypothetical protein